MLPDLATVADLSARGVTPTAVHTTMLKVASSLVREAAGSPIRETQSTVALWIVDGSDSEYLTLPGQPIKEVTAVSIAGAASTRFRLVYGRLWLGRHHTPWSTPVEVVVDMTHGYPTVPPHIVQLVCDLAILGANAASEGAHDPNVMMESIDDYRVSFAEAGEAVASAMTLPQMTRRALKAQHGGGAGQVEYR